MSFSQWHDSRRPWDLGSPCIAYSEIVGVGVSCNILWSEQNGRCHVTMHLFENSKYLLKFHFILFHSHSTHQQGHIYSQHFNVLCFYIPRVLYTFRALSLLFNVLPIVYSYFVIRVTICTRGIDISLLKHRETYIYGIWCNCYKSERWTYALHALAHFN